MKPNVAADSSSKHRAAPRKFCFQSGQPSPLQKLMRSLVIALQTGRRSWADGHPDESVLRVLVDKKLSAAPDTPLKACFSEREFRWLESHRDASHFKKMLQVMRPRKSKVAAEVQATAAKGGAGAAESSGEGAASSREQLHRQPALPSVYPAVAASLGLDSLLIVPDNAIQASGSTGGSKSSRSSAKKTPRKSRRQPGTRRRRT